VSVRDHAAGTSGEREGRTALPLSRVRRAFRQWRRSRPFWGGLLAIIAGFLILLGPLTAYKLIFAAGQIVWLGILVGALVSIMGLFV
jgi:hypothetical protein